MKNTAQESTYQRIKEALVNKQILPGMQLVEAQLSELFQISRTPIRNALMRLEAEGYVEQIKNRGTFVINPSADEIVQAFEVRTTLELALVKDTEADDLRQLAMEMRRYVVDERHAVENAQFQPYMESNRNFHMALISRAKNTLMKKLYVQVFDQLVIFLTLYEDFYDVEAEYESSLQEHQSICDAMAKSSFKELERLVYMHEASTIKSLHLEKIKSRDLKEILLK